MDEDCHLRVVNENNFLVCHLLCFMFNHLKHNLKVVEDFITCRFKHVLIHVDLLLSCNAYKLNSFRCLIYMYVKTLWGIQIFTTLTYSEIIINVTSLLDIIRCIDMYRKVAELIIIILISHNNNILIYVICLQM